MVSRVAEVSGHADTQEQGAAVYAAVIDALSTEDVIVVSFDAIRTATSSFVNTAFVPLLTSMTLDEIKRRVRIVQSSRQINDMIKRRLLREAELATAT